jgi:hypothetical protein
MARKYIEDFNNGNTVHLLDTLVDENTGSIEYAKAMYNSGVEFGNLIITLTNNTSYTLACTVEDADSLGKGIIDVLESKKQKVFLTVFWNKRFNIGTEDDLGVAPIIKEYHEKGDTTADTLIIIKSIISSSCVVRTNLTRLIEKSDPKQIFVVAPVLLDGAIKSLEDEFDPSITNKFKYLYFAVDSDKSKEGIVIPGIGGDVYKRLGFGTQADKNKFVPAIVRQRRYK